jgi:hypothetical protein
MLAISDTKLIAIMSVAIFLRNVLFPEQVYSYYQASPVELKVLCMVSRLASHKLNNLHANRPIGRVVVFDLIRNLPNLLIRMLLVTGHLKWRQILLCLTVTILTSLSLHYAPKLWLKKARYLLLWGQLEFRMFWVWCFILSMNQVEQFYSWNFFMFLMYWHIEVHAQLVPDIIEARLYKNLQWHQFGQFIWSYQGGHKYHFLIVFLCQLLIVSPKLTVNPRILVPLGSGATLWEASYFLKGWQVLDYTNHNYVFILCSIN